MDKERKTGATTTESLHLPEEIVEEILARLPVKSLLRLRCVSKSWLSLIDSKRFIETHLQYSTKNTDSDHHRLLIFRRPHDLRPYQSKQCPLRPFLEEPAGSDLWPFCHPMPGPIAPYLYNNVCCCNGVVCVYKRGRFLLLNPTTRVSKELPEDPEIDYSNKLLPLYQFGFGWDESSGAYKVFAEWYKCRVYSSKTNSWKTVEDPYLRYSSGGGDMLGTFVGGKLHWLRRSRTIIRSFDLKSEVFGTIELPGEAGERWFGNNLGVVGGCLCLSVDDGKKFFNVWVMKKSWEKLAPNHLVGEFIRYGLGELIGAVLIGDAANGEILIASRTNLLVYCPRNGVIRHCRDIGCFYVAHLYVESLVSPVREIASPNI